MFATIVSGDALRMLHIADDNFNLSTNNNHDTKTSLQQVTISQTHPNNRNFHPFFLIKIVMIHR